MTIKARIENGIVQEILSADPFPPFHPSLMWVPCDASVQPGWTYDGTTFSAPAPMPIAEAQAQAWARIMAFRDTFRKTSGYLVGVKWFHSDDYSKQQQMALVMLGASLPPVEWKTMDGSFVTMTPALAAQVFGAAVASDQAVFTQAEVHRAAMLASASPETYDFTTGWPQAFA